MVCYNGVKHYAQLFCLKTFETIENDFAIYLQSNGCNAGNCVFVKSPWGLLKVKAGRDLLYNSNFSMKQCCDFFSSLTKEKAEEYINKYVQQKTEELTKSIAKRTKRIDSAKKLNEKEQKQLEEFACYSKEKEK